MNALPFREFRYRNRFRRLIEVAPIEWLSKFDGKEYVLTHRRARRWVLDKSCDAVARAVLTESGKLKPQNVKVWKKFLKNSAMHEPVFEPANEGKTLEEWRKEMTRIARPDVRRETWFI